MLDIIEANGGSSAGYLTAYPYGSTKPSASLNWPAGKNFEWTTSVPLNASGKVTVAIGPGSGAVNLSVGVEGYFTAQDGTISAGEFTPATARVVDTVSTSVIPSSGSSTFQVAGVAGLPSMDTGISSVAANIEILSGSGAQGNFTVYGDDQTPGQSTQQFYSGQKTTSFLTVPLGGDGGITISNQSGGNINVVVDVEGWYMNALEPTINCPQPYADGSWTSTTPDSIGCTVTAPPAIAAGQYLETITSSGTQDTPLSSSNNTSTVATVDPAGGENDLQAAVMDSNGNTLSQANYSFGLGDWSQQPLEASPNDGETVPTPVSLSALPAGNTAFMDDDEVVYTVSANSDMSSPLWTSSATQEQAAIPDGILQDGSTYYWTATASGTTDWSGDSAQVTTDPQAFTVDNSVSDAETTIADDPTFTSASPSHPDSSTPGSMTGVSPKNTAFSAPYYKLVSKKLVDSYHPDYTHQIGACRASKSSTCKFTANATVGMTIQTEWTMTKPAIAASLGFNYSTSYSYGMEIDSSKSPSYNDVWQCGAMGLYYQYKIEKWYIEPGNHRSPTYTSTLKHAFVPSKNQFACHWIYSPVKN